MTESSKLQNVISSNFDPQSPRAKVNQTALLELLAAIRSQEDTIRLGGGAEGCGCPARQEAPHRA